MWLPNVFLKKTSFEYTGHHLPNKLLIVNIIYISVSLAAEIIAIKMMLWKQP